MKWKELFAPHILTRGYNYFCDNEVESFEVSPNLIRAKVLGTDEYKVDISLRNDEIVDMYCSCPYADEGHYCKHMAAVLYEYESDEQDKTVGDAKDRILFGNMDTPKKYQKKREAVKKLLSGVDRDVLASYLLDILLNDEKLLVRFYSIVNEEGLQGDIKYYQRQIDIITDKHLGRDGFIDYYEADDFILDLEEFLDEDVIRMMERADYQSAFELLNYIFITLGSVEMDDSDGGTSILADRIYRFWIEILAKVKASEKKKIFEWFKMQLKASNIDYLEEYIEQIIMEEFKEKGFRQDKLTFIEEMIDKYDRKESDWSRSYGVGKWALRYLEIVSEDVNSEQERLTFYQKYWKNSSVRKYYIDLCMEKNDYEKAIRVLDESILLDKDYRGLVADYSKKKKEIYLLQGNKEAYLNELWKLVLEHEVGDLDFYKELKKQYPKEEWLIQREEIFKRLPKNIGIERFYNEEKLYDRLLKCVIESGGFYLLQEYESVLKKDYPEQLLRKYELEINKMAIHTNTRKHYKNLVLLLQHMQKLKGGSKEVQEIVKQWRIQYKTRPAMLDELSKL
ncbi:MAG TPA: SWIM zinc finger family protein [Candidatus Merdenecus merdavium]|nr:SWIM zinc finger family protein [Candidatus Merdenecus merdavium]